MTLADTSVWIDHLRSPNEELILLLGGTTVLMHPMIVAEIALGSLKDRKQTLFILDRLPMIRVAQMGEVREMIERQTLYSKGIGLTDAHLLASCLLEPGTQLWTGDRRLQNAAASMGIATRPGWTQ